MSKPEQAAAPAAKPTVKLPPSPGGPFMRFYFPERLSAKTLAVLDTVEQAPDLRKNREALCDVIMELTATGLDYFFLRPLQLAKAGSSVENPTSLMLGNLKKMMSPVVRNIIGKMETIQLLTVCAHIRQLMV